MIVFEKITKKFRNKVILNNISLEMKKGEFIAIIGESGCGKTTLLKMINRLIKPTSGDIYINGKSIKKVDEVKLRRNMGYVIQQTGLFPHLTIQDNIEIIPKLEKMDKKILEKKTMQLMEMVGLNPEDYLKRYPSELSGGQQQRIGIARAFIMDPDIVLMDEPFSALDPMTRSDLQDEVINLHKRLKKTIVFVTHDMDEAIKMADKICIMRNGIVLQYDTPEQILREPVDEYVSNFIGKNRIWASPEFIKIEDIMMSSPVVASKSFSVAQCMEKMRQHKVDSLLLLDPETKQLEGIVKAKKIRTVQNKTEVVENYMRTDFQTLFPEQNILEALKIVKDKKQSVIPVIDNNRKLKGLITKSSLVTTLSEQYFEEEDEE